MKLLIYGINFLPELTGIGKYTGEMAEWFANEGWDVRVVTAPPYYPSWTRPEGYSPFWQKENIGTITVWRCPLWIPAKPTGARRLVHLASFALSSTPVLLTEALLWRPDVILTVVPAFFCVPGALVAGKLSGARTWLHIQDFEIDAAFDLGFFRSPVLRRIVNAVEGKLLEGFGSVSTISPSMRSIAILKGVDERRSFIFKNWVDLNAISPDAGAGLSFRRHHDIPEDKTVLLYSGNMGEKQGLDIIVEAAAMLQERTDLLFLICGDGAARGRLEEKAVGLKNVRFLPLQPVEMLNSLLNCGDIHLLPQKSGAADLVLPSKLTGMLASGRPVIATAAEETALANIVLAAGGLICPPEDTVQFVSSIEILLSSNSCRERGIAARQYAEENLGKDAVLRAIKHRASDEIGGHVAGA